MNTKHYAYAFSYLDKEGHVFNQFLDLVAIPDGRADTIVTAVTNVILTKGLPMEKLYGLWTDDNKDNFVCMSATK